VSESSHSLRRTLCAGALIVVIAATLRLPYGDDIEYKLDERFTFELVQSAETTGSLPMLGMPSSAGPANPGLSVWVFIGVAKLFPVDDPPALARAVQILSVVGIFALILFIATCVPKSEREAWWWATLLIAVNPMAVVFHRKIWPPSLFPIVIVMFLFAWWYRDRRWGAFLWGMVGVLIGQIHMPGFFFFAAFGLWAFLFDRRNVRWTWFVPGVIIGLLPMIPWMIAWFDGTLGSVTKQPHWLYFFDASFWRRWVTQSIGFGISHAFTSDEWRNFLRYPLIAGMPTYFVALAHLCMITCGLWILYRASRRLYTDRRSFREKYIADQSPTGFTLSAAIWGYGLFIAMTCMSTQRHYLLVLFPLGVLALVRIVMANHANAVRWSRAILIVLCVSQALVSASFLRFVHDQPTMMGEYGVPYSRQTSFVLISDSD